MSAPVAAAAAAVEEAGEGSSPGVGVITKQLEIDGFRVGEIERRLREENNDQAITRRELSRKEVR